MRRIVIVVALSTVLVGGAWATGVGPFDDVDDTTGFPETTVDASGTGSNGADDGSGGGSTADTDDGSDDSGGEPVTRSGSTTVTVGADGGGGGGTDRVVQRSGAHGSDGAPRIDFRITGIEPCGQTCRAVTVELTNHGSVAAEDVTVYSRLYAGKTMDPESLVWSEEVTGDALPAGATVTRTRKVTVTVAEGMAIRNADGWMAGRTDVATERGTTTFVDRYDVDG